MIETHGLSKRFPNETAIDYRDLKFETGKSYMLVGASGCGKSTLLNMIAGILSPDKGRIIIDGVDMTLKTQKEKDAFRIRHVGFVFQDFKLLNDMTVGDNIDILKLEGVDTSGADELLARLDMLNTRNKPVKHLSGGQKQRVAVIRALVKRPDIVLADEPTGNLHYQIGRQVVAELSEIARGKTFIAVTHDDRLADLFDEVIDMNDVTGGRYDSPAGGERNA